MLVAESIKILREQKSWITFFSNSIPLAQISSQMMCLLSIMTLAVMLVTPVTPLHVPKTPQRREFIRSISSSTILFAPLLVSLPVAADPAGTIDVARPDITKPEITQKVYFDVRISRSDGTFAVRDDDGDDPVLRSRLTFGLYGKSCPVHSSRFLSYVDTASDGPSYASSTFPSLDPNTGVVEGGKIKGLEVSNFNGQSVLNYGGQIGQSVLWLEVSER